MLRNLLRFLWGPPPASPPRLRDLLERQEALEGEISGLRKRVKSLEGQLSGGRRGNPELEGPQDAPGREIEEQPEHLYPPTRQVQPTAQLARRFKIGG